MVIISDEKCPTEFECIWPRIERTLYNLLEGKVVSMEEWHALVRAVYTICYNQDCGKYLLTCGLQRVFFQFVEGIQREIWAGDGDVMSEYVKHWKRYYFLSMQLPRGFRELEKRGESWGNVQESAVNGWMLGAWAKHTFADPRNRDLLLRVTVQRIKEQSVNDSKAIDGDVSLVCQSFVALKHRLKLDIFEEFKELYFATMTHFYRLQSDEVMAQRNIPDYLEYVYNKLNDEDYRAQQYLCSQYTKEFKSNLVDIFITRRIATLEAEFIPLVKLNDSGKLRVLYQLLQLVPDHFSKLPEQLGRLIYEKCRVGIQALAESVETKQSVYVDKLLEIYHPFTELIQEAFSNDKAFLEARDNSFRHIVNDASLLPVVPNPLHKSKTTIAAAKQDETLEERIPNLLATYCHSLLKNTKQSRLQTQEVEAKLNGVLQILKYVDSKDYFMLRYKEHLKSRIFLATSRDTEAEVESERTMLHRLSSSGISCYDLHDPQKLLSDLQISRDLNKHVKAQYPEVKACKYTTCTVLTMTKWMTRKTAQSVKLPKDFADYVSIFERFYHGRHGGRQLKWDHASSIGILQFTSNHGVYTLKLSTYQIIAILALDKYGTQGLSYEALRLETELEERDLRLALVSLLKKRGHLLIASPPLQTHPFGPHTLFRINDDFEVTKNGKSLKPGTVVDFIPESHTKTDKRKMQDEEDIMNSREVFIREAIIKIMKSRKVCHFEVLKKELITLLQKYRSFYPSPKMVQQQVEYLIKEESLDRKKSTERDDKDTDILVYIF